MKYAILIFLLAFILSVYDIRKLLKYGLIGITIVLLSSCEKDVDPSSACDLTFPFFDVQWELTSVQPSECLWMLSRIEYRGDYFYTVGNHCVDMATFVAGCDGVNICDDNTRLCNRILEKGESLGLVAVEMK